MMGVNLISFLDCPQPCRMTHIKTTFIDEKLFEDSQGGSSRIDLVFSKNVDTYIHDFPVFSLTKFLAAFGGSFGLWLGLGVLQILESFYHHCKCNLFKI